MAETGLELSKLLRDPDGKYRCDIILALTHCRFVNLPKQTCPFAHNLSRLPNVRSLMDTQSNE